MIITDVKGYGLSSPFGTRGALGHPLKLKSLGIIEVQTDTGHVGLGETYAGVYAPELIGPAADFLRSFLIGKDAEDIDFIHHKLEQIPFIGRNGFMLSIASAINIALWDLKGKAQGVPVWKLLTGRCRDKVRVYASGGSSVFTPKEIKNDVEMIQVAGYSAYKMRVGYQPWTEDLRRIEAAVRQLKGADLMIDAIMGSLDPAWDADTAIARSKDLAKFNPVWLEEPVHPSNLDGLKALHGASPVPIATGEALGGAFEFDHYLDANAVDYLQPDATHSGGLSDAVRIIDRAMEKNIKIALHVWGGAVALSANAHLAIAAQYVDILEIPMMHLDITAGMFLSSLDICEGFLRAPQEPGLGVKLTEEMKEKYKLVPGSGYRI